MTGEQKEEQKESRARFTVFATLLMFVVVIPLAIVGTSYYQQNQNRIEDNEKAIARERVLRNRSDWLAYEGCVDDEARDAALVTALTQLVPASSRPQAIIDLIDALEPADELDCPIPVGPRPPDLP